ncbi:type II toxin-antitoxin system HicA family toxin [Pantoea sp. SIMBA_133]
MKNTELIKLLEGKGWQFKRVKGAHMQLIHPGLSKIITIPYTESELKPATVRHIKEVAGLN